MSPLLTIAVPTYNRADFLEMNLKRIEEALRGLDLSQVEILVSDNASTDRASAIIDAASAAFPIRVLRQSENIGSDRNFVVCYKEAKGQYVILLSDDDLIDKGTIAFVLDMIGKHQPGVICLRPFGYDRDPDAEWPHVPEGSLVPLSPDEFLLRAGALVTLISSLVIRKTEFDPESCVGTNLVQVPMVMEALGCGPNFVTRQYRIACKRNNSGGYDFFQIFVTNLFGMLDRYRGKAVTDEGLERFGRKLLIQFFPEYVFRALRSGATKESCRAPLEARFGKDATYRLLLGPVFWLPRTAALVWAGGLALVGRAAHGDGRRLAGFVFSKLRGRVRGALS